MSDTAIVLLIIIISAKYWVPTRPTFMSSLICTLKFWAFWLSLGKNETKFW